MNNNQQKIAKKAFHSANIQKSWKAHMQAFAPILEPAFTNDFKSRIHLIDALNHLSRREFEKALKKLVSMENACVTNEDKAAWLFFMGLLLEMSGYEEEAISYYIETNKYEHHFYLPYLRLAKLAHNGAVFEIAERNYCGAIHCFGDLELDPQSRTILASVYTNLSSCLTMMHRYDDAKNALEQSRQILLEQPGREATEAILYAAMRDEEKIEQCLEKLSIHYPAMYTTTKKMTDEIMSDEHAHFCVVPIEQEPMIQFWQEFLEEERDMRGKIMNEDTDEVLMWLADHLTPLFPFMKRPLEFSVMIKDRFFQVELTDFFAVSLHRGYEMLLEFCPKEVKVNWKFVIQH